MKSRKNRFPLNEEGVARIKFGEYLTADFEELNGAPICTNAKTLSGNPLICSVYDGTGASERVFEFDILTAVVEWDAMGRVMIVKACWDSDDEDMMDVISTCN